MPFMVTVGVVLLPRRKEGLAKGEDYTAHPHPGPFQYGEVVHPHLVPRFALDTPFPTDELEVAARPFC